MINDQEKVYRLLNEFMEKAIDQTGFQWLQQADKIFIFFGFNQDFIDYYFNNEQFQIDCYRKCQYLIIKEITHKKKKIFICNFPFIKDININNDQQKQSYSISRFIAFKLHERNKNSKICCIIHQQNTKSLEIQNAEQFFQTYFFTMINDSDSDSPFFALFEVKGIELFRANQKDFALTLIERKIQDKETDFFFQQIDHLSIEYITNKVSLFMSQIILNLSSFYKSLKHYSQFPKYTENFDQCYKDYIFGMKQKLQCIRDKDYFLILDCIVNITKSKEEILNKQVQLLFEEENENFQLFCLIQALQIKDLTINLQINVQNYQIIYQKYFWILNAFDWGIQLIIQIREFVFYQSQYIQSVEKNDWSFQLKFIHDIEFEQRQAIFLLGETQQGKSTFISILENPNNLQTAQDENGRTIFKQVPNTLSIFTINDTGFSNNNRKILNFEYDNLLIYDCPGFNDTQENFKLINSFNIWNHLQSHNQPIFSIFLNCVDKNLFIQSFINIVNHFRVYNSNFFQESQHQLIFVLTKVKQQSFIFQYLSQNPNANHNRNQFLKHPDIKKYINEFTIFFLACDQQRIVYFYHAEEQISMNRKAIFYKLSLILQQNNQEQIQQVNLLLKPNYQLQYQHQLNDLDQCIYKKFNFTAQFLCDNLIVQMLFQMYKPIEEKFKETEILIELIEKGKNKMDFSTFTQFITQFCQNNKYQVSQFDMQEIENLQKCQKIFGLKSIISLERQKKKLVEIKNLIKTIKYIKVTKRVAYTSIGLVISGAAVVSGISLATLFAKGGQYIFCQVAKRACFGIGNFMLSSVVQIYYFQNYEDNKELLDQYQEIQKPE